MRSFRCSSCASFSFLSASAFRRFSVSWAACRLRRAFAGPLFTDVWSWSSISKREMIRMVANNKAIMVRWTYVLHFHFQFLKKRPVCWSFYCLYFLLFGLVIHFLLFNLVLPILVSELQRHNISTEEESILLGKKGFGGVVMSVVFDKRKALDGTEVLARCVVFRDVDVLNGTV